MSKWIVCLGDAAWLKKEKWNNDKYVAAYTSRSKNATRFATLREAKNWLEVARNSYSFSRHTFCSPVIFNLKHFPSVEQDKPDTHFTFCFVDNSAYEWIKE